MSVDIAQQVVGSGSSRSGTARLINWRLSPETEFHLALGVLNLLAAAGLWSLQAPFAFPIDDAYITLHNAEVLASGYDANYGVSALVGATSPIHLVAVALLVPSFGTLPAGYLVSVLGAAAYLHGLAALGLRSGASKRITSCVVAIGLGTGYTIHHLLNGLETGLALAGVTWSVVLARSSPHSRLLPVLCGLLPFIRPELGVLALALLIRQFWLHWLVSEPGSDAWGMAIRDATLAAAASLPWLIWIWSETGGFLPGTVGAKQAFFAETELPLSDKLTIAFAALNGAAFGPVLVALALLRADSLALALWFFVACFTAAFVAIFPAGLHQNLFRYVYLLLPVALCAWCHLLDQCKERFFRILLGAAIAWTAYTISLGWTAYQTARLWTLQEQVALAEWVEANLPANSKILIHDAGYIAYSTELRLIDAVGLKTPDSIADHRRWTAPSGGSERHMAIHNIAARHQPTHAVILRDKRGYWAHMADDLRRTGWRLQLLRGSAASPGYDVFKLTPPA
jgi:hypothetical protein